ncbi:unnamed protein product [Fraxinus pennsylvanica]|uniref:DUF4408 domain-containing protein n=1 Tax=Fraxinus pennsylvanica TaxID=56036 RepID=A0AAD1ZVT7_9LAMI|nr:unnamed protein product [Fraxinus pennsylvanica]
MNSLSSVSLPNIFTFLFTAKFLFVVGNIIVIILIKESKQAAGSNISPVTEIYDKYVAKNRSNYILANKKVQEDKIENTEDKILHMHTEKKKEMKIGTDISSIATVELALIKRGKREKEEENYIPTEELNRRVEAYIARVNRQRLLEAKSLVCRRA